ncbi:MAG: response regulator [Candidatus Omnitrophota bacterium]|nr:response regulator [Candidatus Omnitrophota bacterium]
MDKYKVLIADDEPDVLEVLSKKISQEGYDVVTAEDGKEALDKIYKDSPDVILLDIRMPKMDGFAVLKELRENPKSKKWQPVIIISAVDDLENIKKGYNLEADYYLTKPCNFEAILNGIKIMLNLAVKHKTKKEIQEGV